VPPHLARILALSIRDQVFNLNVPVKIDYLSENQKLNFRSRKNKLTDEYLRIAKNNINKIKIKPDNKIDEYKKTETIAILKYDLVRPPNSFIGLKFKAKYKIDSKAIRIDITDFKKTDDFEFSLKILPARNLKINSPENKVIEINVFSLEYESIQVAWKILVEIIRKNYFKDDLIQYFGYYQYPTEHQIELNFPDNQKIPSTWKLIKLITNGFKIGEIVNESNFTDILGLNSKEFYKQLSILKDIGYEIRNENTNSQIKKNLILIPYRFPTLTSRSLQSYTHL
jgi:DNA (cytosine-5)-methyltransferase 1